jgi:hypothetical protein
MNKLCINAAKLECSFNGEMKESKKKRAKRKEEIHFDSKVKKKCFPR